MHMTNERYSNKISFETYLSRGGVREGLGGYGPSSEHHSPHRKVETVFFELFNSYSTLLKVFWPTSGKSQPTVKKFLAPPLHLSSLNARHQTELGDPYYPANLETKKN